MKNYSKFLIVALIAVLVLPACKKYEEGPTLSFRSKKARLVNQWKVDKVLQFGIDVTTVYTTNQQNEVLEFKDDGTVTDTYVSGGTTHTAEGTWKFSSDKKKVDVDYTIVSYSWDILRLKNDELWLKSTLAGTLTEIHFVTN